MGVRSALVDTAVSITRQATGPRVDGQTPMGDVESVPFKCRLAPPSSSEKREDSYYKQQRDFTLIVAPKDNSGVVTVITGDMRLKVTSKVYGEKVYEVVGEPVAIRSKRKLILFQCAVRRFEHATPPDPYVPPVPDPPEDDDEDAEEGPP